MTISSTRSNRSIKDIPTRVEFIAGEELEEKANMKPGDIRMVLSESTGIQMQQTSATSANAAIRIQGLDGRYLNIKRWFSVILWCSEWARFVANSTIGFKISGVN